MDYNFNKRVLYWTSSLIVVQLLYLFIIIYYLAISFAEFNKAMTSGSVGINFNAC